LTAPVLFAIAENPKLVELIESGFEEVEDLNLALSLVRESSGIQQSRDLAKDHVKLAKKAIEWLPASVHKQALFDLTDYILERLY
jgi:all-trans-nonaprenyl-diphosphate synthase